MKFEFLTICSLLLKAHSDLIFLIDLITFLRLTSCISNLLDLPIMEMCVEVLGFLAHP